MKQVAHPELRSINDLKPAPYNPRRIDDDAAAGLGASIEAFGDIAGIVWNQRTGHLVAGHQRVEQLRKLGGQFIDGKVVVSVHGELHDFPVRVVDWSEADEKAANVAANNPHVAGEFTPDLQAMLDEIQAADAELFRDARLDALLEDLPTEPEITEWDAGDIDMRSMFIFRAPIEMQAKIRAVLADKFPDLDFDEEVILG